VKRAQLDVGFTIETLADKLGYIDSESTLAADRVRQDLTPGRSLGYATKSRYADAVADLSRGVPAAYERFNKSMIRQGVRRRLSLGEWAARHAAGALKEGKKLGLEPWEVIQMFGSLPPELDRDDEVIVPAK
jgi:hypothetical protein